MIYTNNKCHVFMKNNTTIIFLETLTAHQHICLDSYISTTQRFYSGWLSKITKYNRRDRELNHGPEDPSDVGLEWHYIYPGMLGSLKYK